MSSMLGQDIDQHLMNKQQIKKYPHSNPRTAAARYRQWNKRLITKNNILAEI